MRRQGSAGAKCWGHTTCSGDVVVHSRRQGARPGQPTCGTLTRLNRHHHHHHQSLIMYYEGGEIFAMSGTCSPGQACLCRQTSQLGAYSRQ
eukprot:364192-Chlamydomonas_euryale.AAC.8